MRQTFASGKFFSGFPKPSESLQRMISEPTAAAAEQ
jgi:hypothetical protein